MKKLSLQNCSLLAAVSALLLSALDVSAAPTPATILIGGHVVPFQVKPYVGPNGQVMAPVDAVQLLGAKYRPNADGTVTVTGASGQSITAPYTFTQGRYCVAFQKVALALGGLTDWQPTTTTLTVRARLQMVRQNANQLSIYTSYPVYYSVKRISSPERLYVDLYGLTLGTAPASVPASGGDISQIRSGQMNDQTVRITVDLKNAAAFQVLSGIETSQVKVALGSAADPPAPSSISAAPPRLVVALPPHLPDNPRTVTITGVDYKMISPELTRITVTASGAAKYTTEMLDSPNRLAFDLAGAVLDKDIKTSQTVNNPVIKAIRVGRLLTPKTKFGRVVLDLSRLVGFTVDSQPDGDGMTYSINVITSEPAAAPVAPYVPSVPTNVSLAGKVIVIDPGHGGKDSGATADLHPFDVYEKNITLAIARRVQTVLMANGATVIMTRSDDSFPALESRPALANARHADYFISIHADSSAVGRNTLAGTTVYFHGQSSVCRLMAADIGRRISEASGLSYNGIKSDTIRFRTGFAVLRGSEMPAVLVETGYMNNDRDLAKLRDDAGQQRIAEGITAGLRDFIADQVRMIRSARTLPSASAATDSENGTGSAR